MNNYDIGKLKSKYVSDIHEISLGGSLLDLIADLNNFKEYCASENIPITSDKVSYRLDDYEYHDAIIINFERLKTQFELDQDKKILDKISKTKKEANIKHKEERRILYEKLKKEFE
jgi:hypothetical protein